MSEWLVVGLAILVAIGLAVQLVLFYVELLARGAFGWLIAWRKKRMSTWPTGGTKSSARRAACFASLCENGPCRYPGEQH